jgi:hypothetical protein
MRRRIQTKLQSEANFGGRSAFRPEVLLFSFRSLLRGVLPSGPF